MGSAAITTHSFRIPFTAAAMPDIIPPPLMGTITTSRSGTCSMNSSPMVPCPQMTGP